MHRIWILAALLLVISSPSQAGKLYKIVDADGQVTFSQYPPAEKSEHAIIEDIKLSGTSQAAVSQVGNSLYCGETRLPNPPVSQSQQARFLQDLVHKQKRWTTQLDALEEKIERDNYAQFKSGQNNYRNDYQKAQRSLDYQKRKDKNVQTIKELRCAINWGDSKRHEVDNYTADNSKEVARLQKIYKNLEQAIQVHCGAEPLLDPSNKVATRLLSEWTACSQDFRSDLRKVDNQLRQAARNNQRVN